jgi:hypothetical protein
LVGTKLSPISGRVHDALAEFVRSWRATLVREIGIAIDAGDLPAETDPERIAFALEALGSGTNPARQLQGDATVSERCLRAMHTVLRQLTAHVVG